MAEFNLRSWPEISQATDGLQLNPPLEEANTVDLTAAQLDRICAALTHLEARLALTVLRVGELRGPPQPDPDPPDPGLPYGAPHPTSYLNSGWDPSGVLLTQPPYQPPRPPSCWDPPEPVVEQLPFTYTNPYLPLQNLVSVTPWQTMAEPYFHNQPPSSHDYLQPPQLSSTTAIPHQTHQPPPPPTNSIDRQPYTTFDAAAQPQPYLHHPSHPPCSGPDPYVQQCLPDAGYPPWQLEYQPPRPLPLPNVSPTPMHSTSCWSPPSHLRSAAPLPAVDVAPTPPPLRSGPTHPPQSPKQFIDSGWQHGLTNNPNLLVRSPSPAQLAAVSDYNEKLRVYRLDQAALLARVTAWFE